MTLSAKILVTVGSILIIDSLLLFFANFSIGPAGLILWIAHTDTADPHGNMFNGLLVLFGLLPLGIVLLILGVVRYVQNQRQESEPLRG